MSQDSRSDTELIRACLAGNKRGWDALIARYQRYLYAVPIRMGVSPTDAEEVFQNTCIKLYQHLEELKDTEKLSSWLAAVVRQEVRSLRRGRKPISIAELPQDDEASALQDENNPSPEDWIIAVEKQSLVRAALSDLSPDCFELLMSLYGDKPSSYAEIAAERSISIGTVGPRRARCLQRLIKILQEQGW